MKISFIYKSSFIIYRFILMLSVPLLIVSQLLVGLAGHNSDPNNTNYIFFIFAVFTSILLTILNNSETRKFKWRKKIRYCLIILVLVSVIFEISELSKLIQESEFRTAEIITILLAITFTVISIILLYGLFKNKY